MGRTYPEGYTLYDNLIRVENEQAAAELLEMTEQMGNRSV